MHNHYTKIKHPDRKLSANETAVINILSDGILLDIETMLDIVAQQVDISFLELKIILETFIEEKLILRIAGATLDSLITPATGALLPRYNPNWIEVDLSHVINKNKIYPVQTTNDTTAYQIYKNFKKENDPYDY